MHRVPVSKATRVWIAERQNSVCRSCNEPLGFFFHIDHIIPLSAFTETEASQHAYIDLNNAINLQALCGTCHTIKSGLEAGRLALRHHLRKNILSSNVCFGCGVSYSTYFPHSCYTDGLCIVKERVNFKEWQRVG